VFGGISVLQPLAARTLDDHAVTLESLRGQPVLLNVWATWCEPCRRELPVLQALAEQYKGQGLKVVGVSVDRNKTLAELRRFVARRNLTYAMWHDKADAASGILGVGTLPATFLISSAGIVMWKSSGVVVPKDPGLARSIKAALGPKRP